MWRTDKFSKLSFKGNAKLIKQKNSRNPYIP